MSSVPPTTPPGGVPPPYPPYDPKTQWRVYREQQRAAWRAQRDAWRAQRYAIKASYANAYGPRVPSLVGPVIFIGVGIVALLVYAGRIAAGDFWGWYGRWWPLLFIFAGLALLVRVGAGHAPQDSRSPPRRHFRRHPHPACHPGLWRRRMESLPGPWFSRERSISA